MTSRCQGLFPPHPFFKGKALGTRSRGPGYLGGKLDLTATRDAGFTKILARDARFFPLVVGNSGIYDDSNTLKALDNIDINQMSHRYVSSVLQND